MKRIFKAALLVLFLSFAIGVYAAEWTGKCVAITDGDTLQVMHKGKAEKIRLDGIDCPETGQIFGTQARQAASSCVFEKEVKVIEHGKDMAGRTLGEVLFGNNISLNKSLVKSGVAWWYREYAKDNKELETYEKEARDAKRGLWSDKHPVAPWDYRHNVAKPALPPNPSKTGITTIKLLEAIPHMSQGQSKNATPDPDETVYVTDSGTKYHRVGCKCLIKPNPMPLSQAAARYEPCSVCNPPRINNSVSNVVHSTLVASPQVNRQVYSATPTVKTTTRGYQIYTGPRGGRYHFSKSGKKIYERRLK